jgi:hypothetical protein
MVREQILRRFAPRGTALFGALVMMLGALVVTQLASAVPADAATTLQKVTGQISPTDSQPFKTAHADCPAGTRVISGGGAAQSTSGTGNEVGLVELQPIHPTNGGLDSFQVTGHEIGANVTANWWVQAYAICASPINGLHILRQMSPPLTEAAVVSCPNGESPLGGGGLVNNPGNVVSLVGAWPLSGNSFRAENQPRTTQEWTTASTVTAFAVCAPTPAGYRNIGNVTADPPAARSKAAFANCPAPLRVYGTGSVIRTAPRPGLALQIVNPSDDLHQVAAVAVDNILPVVAWNPEVAVAICAA